MINKLAKHFPYTRSNNSIGPQQPVNNNVSQWNIKGENLLQETPLEALEPLQS